MNAQLDTAQARSPLWFASLTAAEILPRLGFTAAYRLALVIPELVEHSRESVANTCVEAVQHALTATWVMPGSEQNEQGIACTGRATRRELEIAMGLAESALEWERDVGFLANGSYFETKLAWELLSIVSIIMKTSSSRADLLEELLNFLEAVASEVADPGLVYDHMLLDLSSLVRMPGNLPKPVAFEDGREVYPQVVAADNAA